MLLLAQIRHVEISVRLNFFTLFRGRFLFELLVFRRGLFDGNVVVERAHGFKFFLILRCNFLNGYLLIVSGRLFNFRFLNLL